VKIKSKILLYVLSIFLVAYTVSVFCIYKNVQKNVEKGIYDHLHSVTSLQKNRVRHAIAQNIERCRLIATRTKMRISLANYLKQENEADLKIISRILNDAKRSTPDIKDIFIMDTDGKVLASTDPVLMSKDYKAEKFFHEGLGSDYLSDIIKTDTGSILFYLSGPLTADGKVIGVLGVIVGADIFFEIVEDHSGLGRSGETYLINEERYMITPSRFSVNAILVQKDESVNALDSLKHEAEGHIGRGEEKKEIYRYKDYRGEDVIGSHEYISEKNWGLIVKIDEEEIFKPVGDIRNISIIVGGATIIFILLTMAYASGAIARPIRRLNEGIKKINEGDLDHRVALKTTDEIGHLSRQFDGMTARLKESTVSKEYLHGIIDAVAHPMYVIDAANYKIKMANKAAAAGEEQRGLTCYSVTHYSDKPCSGKEHVCPLRKIKETRKPVKVEHVHYDHSSGEKKNIEIHAYPLLNNKGELKEIVEYHFDITERRKTEEAMREAIEAKLQFTSMVSHELRTPLGPIKEGAHIILDGLTGSVNEEQKDLLMTVKRNADRLNRIVNDVLDFHKLEAGHGVFVYREDDINECLMETHEAMSLVTEKKGIDLTVDLDENIPKIKFDRDKILQVLTNLVNNAIKFTEEGSIRLISRKEDNAVHVTVKDTGPGIKKEDMHKLFKSFQQLDMARQQRKGGTGLGLAISKAIITNHRGKIWVESEFGKGAAFHFILPVKEKRA